MRVGLHIGKFDWPGGPEKLGPTLGAIARTADAAGFSSLWVMDHLFQLGTQYGIVHGPVDAPMLEGYSTIAYLAGITQRIQLGVLVTSAFYRHPGILLKIASTIDALSGGRTYFGLGAGWFEREARGLGIPFPPLRERFERLEETLRIARQLWNSNEPESRRPFAGTYYQLEEPLNAPQPLSRPHPPIIIGGSGERRTLRLVAEYADACNIVLASPLHQEAYGDLRAPSARREEVYRHYRERLRHKFEVLAQHCQSVGRPFTDIEKTAVTYLTVGPGGLEPAEIIELCAELSDLGVQHMIFNIPDSHTLVPLERIGQEVIPVVEGFG